MSAIIRRFSDTVVRDVYLSSRYEKLTEIEHMQRVVEWLDNAVACHIASIWCDSKACAFYFVTLRSSRPIDRATSARIPDKIARAFSSAGGYNGVRIDVDCKTFDYDPSWPDEDRLLSE